MDLRSAGGFLSMAGIWGIALMEGVVQCGRQIGRVWAAASVLWDLDDGELSQLRAKG
jgi:hypothetical protein